ncbi:MAG: hypothetical protein FD138_1054 [Planctomycetota bacterium]|nr:MAG: hypothetical protein FD138_1054 [Planctomycetota bacterium]
MPDGVRGNPRQTCQRLPRTPRRSLSDGVLGFIHRRHVRGSMADAYERDTSPPPRSAERNNDIYQEHDHDLSAVLFCGAGPRADRGHCERQFRRNATQPGKKPPNLQLESSLLVQLDGFRIGRTTRSGVNQSCAGCQLLCSRSDLLCSGGQCGDEQPHRLQPGDDTRFGLRETLTKCLSDLR